MLNERKIARSYAAAIFELSEEQGILEKIIKDMELMKQVLKENPQLQKVMASPVLKSSKKSDILNALFASHLNDLTMRFLRLLVKSLRVLYLDEIAKQFVVLYKIHKGIKSVSLVSAVELEDDSRTLMKEMLKAELHAEIELEEDIDPRIIGGFIVQVGDRRFDASLRSKLHKLNRQFDINIYKKGF